MSLVHRVIGVLLDLPAQPAPQADLKVIPAPVDSPAPRALLVHLALQEQLALGVLLVHKEVRELKVPLGRKAQLGRTG